MKRLVILLFLFFGFVITNAQDRFLVSIKAGLSASQVSGDNLAGFNKAGLAGGLGVTTKFNEKWSAQFEMLYIQKGSKVVGNPPQGNFNFYLLKLDYLEVPVLLLYHQKKFIFEGGPGFGYLVREKEYDAFQEITGIRPFNKPEIGINIGVSYTLFKNIGMNWRYSNSITSIRSHASGARSWYNPGQQNTVMSFTLTYTFAHAKTN